MLLYTRDKAKYASVAELADAPDLGSGGEIHAGSIPVTRTNDKSPDFSGLFNIFLAVHADSSFI